jgi:ATP-binding cassette, subfamily B, bacterial
MRRWRRMRVQYQLDSLDCGPCCIGMIAGYYERFYRRQYIRELCEQDRQGASLDSLAKAAEDLGFRTLRVRIPPAELRRARPPCIAFLRRGHFVVIESVTRKTVNVVDPAAGFVSYTHEEFQKVWSAPGASGESGALLLLEPTAQLRASDPKDRFGSSDILRPAQTALRRNVAPLLVGTFVLLGAQAAMPFLSAALVDAGVAGADIGILSVILIGQIVLLLTRAGVELFQGWILAYVGRQLHVTLVSQFLRKFSRLPFAFFMNKRIGDAMQRVEDHRIIQELITEGAGQALLATASFVIFGIILAAFSPLLFGIFAAGSAFYLGYVAWFLRSLRRLNYKAFSLMSVRQSALFQFLAGLEEIKLNNASQYYRWQWERAQIAVARSQIKANLLGLVQHSGGTFLNEVKNALLIVVAAYEVISGNMTLGTMVAVQFVVGQLNWPLMLVIGLMVRANEAYTSFARAREVHRLEDEDASRIGDLRSGQDEGITLSQVRFRYKGLGQQDDVIHDLSLTIPMGKTTAIVGRSGSGKTTLLRLLLQMHPVDGGTIAVGGVDLATVPAKVWRSRCGVVLQDGQIFSDTILNNITMSDENANMTLVANACRIAQADEFIQALPMRYHTRVGMDGGGLSRGQIQRLLIARCLYRNPRYIFLDEATSALDAETEAKVATALRLALEGRTAVVIAHRLSTIRSAHKIVVLDKGHIVEEGDHESLLAAGGYYYRLVKHQLEARETKRDVILSAG